MSRSPIITDMLGDHLPNPHPGEILLEEFLKPMGLSQNRVAREIHVPPRSMRRLSVLQYKLNPPSGSVPHFRCAPVRLATGSANSQKPAFSPHLKP